MNLLIQNKKISNWRFFYFIQFQSVKNNCKIICYFNLETQKQLLYLQPLRQTKRPSLRNGEILKRPTRADCKSAVKTSQVRILLSPQKKVPIHFRDFFYALFWYNLYSLSLYYLMQQHNNQHQLSILKW